MTSQPAPEAASAPVYATADIRRIEAHFLPAARPPLMERAGAAVAERARALLAAREGPVAILCGPGNNGGDGLVAARLLRAAGREVTVISRADPARLPADARAACEAYVQAGGRMQSELPAGAALAIDALFGIGLARPIDAAYLPWIAWLNALDAPVLAVDIPSGLDADSGRVLGAAVRASHTTSFIAWKPGQLTLDGPDHCGETQLCELGLAPESVLPARGRVLAPACFAAALAPRRRNSHKGDMGDAGIVGGAAGMLGAALLAGRAALLLGAGRVFVGTLADAALGVDPLQPELMLRAPQAVIELATALAAGPGLGASADALALVRSAAAREVPLVLDADALNLMARHPVLARQVARRAAPTLLTPHPAEAARLLGRDTAAVQADRVAAACELARRHACHALLKGCGSVLAAPDGRWWINRTGNPGMASAGMGDVLTGLAAALLAQGWAMEHAAQGAVWLHGAAADACVEAGRGPIGLCAGELPERARALLNALIARAPR